MLSSSLYHKRTWATKTNELGIFVRWKMHGLTYQPLKAEHFQKPKVLGELIKDIYSMYKDCSNGEITVVWHKGGHVKKDLLMKLNIPCLNLETLGCPKYDKLRHVIPQEKLLVFVPMTLFIIVLSLNVMLFGSGTKVSLQNMQTSD